ncbi:hypothetical protein C0073_022035 (plasmid) [Aeromonas veronii]|nr:hypothetical protein C0073_022035 [Aeromonas veronii]
MFSGNLDERRTQPGVSQIPQEGGVPVVDGEHGRQHLSVEEVLKEGRPEGASARHHRVGIKQPRLPVVGLALVVVGTLPPDVPLDQQVGHAARGHLFLGVLRRYWIAVLIVIPISDLGMKARQIEVSGCNERLPNGLPSNGAPPVERLGFLDGVKRHLGPVL